MNPTCAVDKSSPCCHTGIVAESPTIHPDPNIDPMPAAVAKGLYSFAKDVFLVLLSIVIKSPFLIHIYINRFQRFDSISKAKNNYSQNTGDMLFYLYGNINRENEF